MVIGIIRDGESPLKLCPITDRQPCMIVQKYGFREVNNKNSIIYKYK